MTSGGNFGRVMKGILLAGGTGSRLMPLTSVVSKQLLPVADKPLVYYPLSTLMLLGIKEVLCITSKRDQPQFISLLGNGDQLGINITYAYQDKPRGIAESLIIADKFIGEDPVTLILGDNVFYGHGLTESLSVLTERTSGAGIVTYQVDNPSQFGVLEVDQRGQPISIQEKPNLPKSNKAITGLYFFDNKAIEYAKSIIPSKRGELEITDILKKYLTENALQYHHLGRGFAWLDTGTHDALTEASAFICAIEKRQGLKIGCIEEIAYRNCWISNEMMRSNIERNSKSSYGDYLKKIAKDAF